jgi:Fe2+ or Zn2+ uptake regulation protein
MLSSVLMSVNTTSAQVTSRHETESQRGAALTVAGSVPETSERACDNARMDTAPHTGDTAHVEEAFQRLGIPLTRQRRVVWDYFATCGRAATIVEAAEAVSSQGVGQATVYRAVALLNDMGLLVRVETTVAEACYTAIGVGHTHPLVCRRCRRVVDFDGNGDLSLLERHLEMTTGFTIYGHHLEVYGVCPECAKRSARSTEADSGRDSG